MADSKLSALTALAATPATDDEIYIRDVSEDAASESKRITIAYLFNNPAIASINAGAADVTIGTTGANKGIYIKSTQDAATGALITMEHVSASAADEDIIAQLYFIGRNDNATPETVYYGSHAILIASKTDGAETGKMRWNLINSGADNEAMRLASTGVLSVDLGGSGSAAQVDLFDDYDDALVLREGIQQHNRELLADIGVLDRKDTGSGYMMKLQPMVRLLAGGIYQSRTMIDNLVARIENIERKLLEAG